MSSAAVLIGSLLTTRNTGRNVSHTGPSISIKINCEFECTLRSDMELAVYYVPCSTAGEFENSKKTVLGRESKIAQRLWYKYNVLKSSRFVSFHKLRNVFSNYYYRHSVLIV